MKNLKMKLLTTAIAFIGWYSVAIAQDKPKQITLFTNVQVFDGVSDKRFKADVLVEGNIIKQISKEPLMVAQTDNVTIINGEGRTLMPGLTDCHWHSMGAYMTGDPFAVGVGKLNLVAVRWGRKDAYAGLHHSERRGRPCI